MNLESLRSKWPQIQRTSSFAERQAFIKDLLSLSTPDAIAYHFDLLKQRSNLDLYQELRAGFAKRGRAACDFLMDRANNDQDIIARGDALQLLGVLRCPSAAPLARRLLESDNEVLRYKAIIVLGWTGSEDDIQHLGEIAKADPSPRLRGMAATALRQIWLRMPDVKDRVTSVLGQVITAENDPEALTLQIVSLQTLVKKSFGLRERLSEGTISGDVDRAKSKAIAFLQDMSA